MTLTFDPRNITAILFAGGEWITVRNAHVVSLDGAAKWPKTLAFETQHSGWGYAPVSSVVAFLTGLRQLSPDEMQESEERRLLNEERLFEWQHYASKEVYGVAFERQGGICAGPKCDGASLNDFAITHFLDGKIYCQLDTPLRHRYGTPD